jgi:hypothetical protein
MLKNDPESITQGDALSLRVHVQEGENGPGIDLTGATFETSFTTAEGSPLVLDDSYHTIEDQTAPETKGFLGIALSSDDTQLLKLGKFQSFVMKITNGAVVTHHRASKFSVLSATPNEDVKPESNILIGGCV